VGVEGQWCVSLVAFMSSDASSAERGRATIEAARCEGAAAQGKRARLRASAELVPSSVPAAPSWAEPVPEVQGPKVAVPVPEEQGPRMPVVVQGPRVAVPVPEVQGPRVPVVVQGPRIAVALVAEVSVLTGIVASDTA
jgi:hypothetical protein